MYLLQPLYGQGIGGEGGIRTLDELLTHTPLAGERLRPLGHLSGIDAGSSVAGDMARWEGVEPPTFWFVARCSIQLSYGCMVGQPGLEPGTGAL